MKRIARSTLQTAVNLVFFAVLGTAILASVFFMTHDAIVKSEEAEKLKLIMQIVPANLFDNDIIQDTLRIPASELLGTDDTTVAYRARLKGEPSAVVLESVAPDGYSGKIWLILAVRANGELAGVRVVAHKETPGLGDYIELPKSPWIRGFDGKSREVYKDADWKVKKDGGQFDYMAGATITPRAVVKAVNKALVYFGENHDKLFVASEPKKETTK
jgi:electron transport complex protein RnfG